MHACCKVAELQSYKITELQSYKITELQSYRITELQGEPAGGVLDGKSIGYL
jgi:hypothetical protein